MWKIEYIWEKEKRRVSWLSFLREWVRAKIVYIYVEILRQKS